MGRGNSTYPLVLTDLAARRCVVIGGGAVAERKVAGLCEGGAQPEVISPSLTPSLAQWHAAGSLRHVARGYRHGDLHGAFLVYAATDDPAINAAVAAEAHALGLLFNDAEQAERGNFHTVGAVRRGDLLLTVSTNGGSPSLAAHLRTRLAAHFGPEYARVLELAAAWREASGASAGQLRALSQLLTSEPILAWLRVGAEEPVLAAIRDLLAVPPISTEAQ